MNFQIDIRTLFFADILILLVSSILLSVLWSQYRNFLNGIAFWLFAFLSFLLAALFIGLRDAIPDSLSYIGANSLYMLGFVFLLDGFRRMERSSPLYLWNYLLVPFVAFVFYWFTFHSLNYLIRVSLLFAAFIIVLLQILIILWKKKDHIIGKKTAHVVNIVIYISLIFLLVINIYLSLSTLKQQENILNPGIQQYAIAFFQLYISIVTFIGIILHINAKQLGQSHQMEEKFRLLVENSLDGIVVHNGGTILYSNPALAKIMGAPSADYLVGKSVIDFVPEKTRPVVLKRMAEALENTELLPWIEEDLNRLDKTTFPAEVSGIPIQYNGGPAVQVTIRDLSERKSYESQLKLFEKIFEHAEEAIFVVDPRDGRLLNANTMACKNLQYTKEELLTKTVSDIRKPLETETEGRWSSWAQQSALVKSKQSVLSYGLHVKKDGTTYPVETLVHYLDLNSGELIISLVRDISERVNAENSLREANRILEEEKTEKEKLLIQNAKMAAMGEMMSAIAHQWKQPLVVIAANAAELKDIAEFEDSGNNEVEEVATSIDGQVKSMLDTMESFRNFFKPTQEKIVFNASESIVEVVQMFSKQFSEAGIKVIVNESENFITEGNPNELKQAVLNILNNSQDAIKDKKIKDGRINCYFRNENKQGVILISDNAGGMPDALLPEKIFEPYITTKGERGTGIGLSVARLIIEEHMKGKITARNREGGAEFSIVLPLA